MARTRSIRIRESLEELEQLRRYHKGTPQERRILFLSFLREDLRRTIPEAARKAGISDRRGRRWWDSYREGGLRKLLDLRIWKKEELKPEELDPQFPEGLGSSQLPHVASTDIDFPAFLVSVAGLADLKEPGKWARTLGDILIKALPEIDYSILSIRSNVNFDTISKQMIFQQHLSPTGEVVHEVRSAREKQSKNYFEDLIDKGKQRKFPFEQYHYPPAGFDFFVRAKENEEYTSETSTIHLGSMLLFRNSSEPPFSQVLLDLVERLRPFLTFLFTDFIVRTRFEKPGADLFNDAVKQVAGDVGLSPREQDVLLLEMLGHSYDEIGDLLNISPKTVQSHVRSIYQKAGVNRLSEFFARYFTPRTLFPEKKTT